MVRLVRVLAIVHQPDAGPGVFADAIRDAGATLDTWLLTTSPESPDDPLGYDAVLTFGGAMHPDQLVAYPSLAQEKAVLGELLDRQVPLLGVCLGSELVAEAAGGEARRTGTPEIGWYRVETTDEAVEDPLMAPLAPGFEALEWHSYETPVPPGAVALARSAACLQAYRVGRNAWGIQFHAEVTLADLEAWLDDYRSDPDAVALGLDPGRLRSQTRALIADWNQLGRDLCARFLAIAAQSSQEC
jgi:GMP synthase-like glutamine amidotransferase